MYREGVKPGQAIILNGVPRSGKSSIAAAIQDASEELWMNLGVDHFIRMTPLRYRPGIGLRPARIEQSSRGKRGTVEPWVPALYAAMYESIAAHIRFGLNVVTDVGHHDDYATPSGILYDCARRLAGLPVFFVGVRCPAGVVWERRRKTWLKGKEIPRDAPPPDPVHQWERAVHDPGIYDLEVDTSLLKPEECGRVIREHLERGPEPTAFRRLAAMERSYGGACGG